MAARRGQKIKILYIIKILTEFTDEQHPLSAKEICEKLSAYNINAERKAIYDDIECLISFGYDIVTTRSPKNGYFLATREFELPEIYLLKDAVKTAKFITSKKTLELTSKLDKMLSVYQVKNDIKNIYINDNNKTNNKEIFYNIDNINEAIKNCKKITFKYAKRIIGSDQQPTVAYKNRTVSPYALTWQDDHYYLICNYEKYDNLMQLRVDRIKSVEILEQPWRHFSQVSEYTDTFDVADYTEKLFGMFGGELQDIKFKAENSILEQIVDRFGNRIFISNVSNTHFNFSVEAALSEGLITWIMNYGDKLEVLKPESLRSQIVERAEQILKIYKKQ